MILKFPILLSISRKLVLDLKKKIFYYFLYLFSLQLGTKIESFLWLHQIKFVIISNKLKLSCTKINFLPFHFHHHYHRHPHPHRSLHLHPFFVHRILYMYNWINNFLWALFASNDGYATTCNHLNMKCKFLHLNQVPAKSNEKQKKLSNKNIDEWSHFQTVCQALFFRRFPLPALMSLMAIKCKMWFDNGNVTCAFGTQLWFALLCVG